jgi:effector-binding domain-containing protein
MMYPIETRELDEIDTAVEMATLSVAEIGPFVGRAYSNVASYLDRKGAGPAGMPFARYHRINDEQFEVEAGFPASTPVSGEGDIEPSDLPAGPAAVTLYVGPYDEMASAYDALTTWIAEHGGEPIGDPWEIYFDDPATQPDPAQLRTEIVMPYRIP